MKRHDRKYLGIIASLGLENEEFRRYVDDETDVDPGVRYDGERLVKIDELVEEDEAVEDDVRTMNLLKPISNTITSCVQYTIDCPSLNSDGRVPILDLGVSVEDWSMIIMKNLVPPSSTFT